MTDARGGADAGSGAQSRSLMRALDAQFLMDDDGMPPRARHRGLADMRLPTFLYTSRRGAYGRAVLEDARMLVPPLRAISMRGASMLRPSSLFYRGGLRTPRGARFQRAQAAASCVRAMMTLAFRECRLYDARPWPHASRHAGSFLKLPRPAV